MVRSIKILDEYATIDKKVIPHNRNDWMLKGVIMSESKFLTVQLSDGDYSRLANEAERLNLPLDILVQRLLKLSLEKIPPPTFDRQKARDAIAGLRKIARNLPPVDAVAIARQSREDLEQRCIF